MIKQLGRFKFLEEKERRSRRKRRVNVIGSVEFGLKYFYALSHLILTMLI